MLRIHTNAIVNDAFYVADATGAFQPLPNGSFRAQVKRDGETVPILSFETGGGSGIGTITKGQQIVAGPNGDVATDVLILACEQPLVADIEPGIYVMDVICTDDDSWRVMDFVQVFAGITSALGVT